VQLQWRPPPPLLAAALLPPLRLLALLLRLLLWRLRLRLLLPLLYTKLLALGGLVTSCAASSRAALGASCCVRAGALALTPCQVQAHRHFCDHPPHRTVCAALRAVMPHIAPVILKRRPGFLGTPKRPPPWALGAGIGRGAAPDPISGSRAHSGALALWAEKRPTPQG
jgi:hypothetical protein